MHNDLLPKHQKTSTILMIIALLSFQLLISCDGDDCVVEECSVSLTNGSIVTVTSDVSGGQGTQITPDIIDPLSITNQSAVVQFTVLRIGKCHEVVGYGHTWSSQSATPRIGTDHFIDYESNLNFNDDVQTLMNGLSPNTNYWVRSWIAIEVQNCTRERIIFYNDNISTFTTL